MKYFPFSLNVHQEPDPKLFEIFKDIRPLWSKETLQISYFSNGTVNKLMAVYDQNNPDDKLLVRINGSGSSSFINRRKEIGFLKMLAEKNFAAELLAEFDNGLVYKYLVGEVITIETISQLPYYDLIARKMAQLHRTFRPNETATERAMIWLKLDQFYSVVPDQFSDSQKQLRFEKLFANKNFLRDEIDFFRKRLFDCDNAIVFCHNDLLTYNIIYDKGQNSVQFIDYEFADYNYQAFDIGNHFGEFAGIDRLDFARYPDEDFQKNWIEIYLKEFHNDETYYDRKEIENLIVLANEFYLVSHLLWALFALFQAEQSFNQDTDFLLMFERRIQDYFKKKPIFVK